MSAETPATPGDSENGREYGEELLLGGAKKLVVVSSEGNFTLSGIIKIYGELAQYRY